MAIVLDSDAVIGFLDRSDPHHEAANAAIGEAAGSEHLVVSVVTYAEVLTGARLGRHPEETVSGFFTEVISEIVPVSPEIADLAATIRAESPTVRLPDALIVATAEIKPEVDTLLTGDQAIARLKGLNFTARLLTTA